MQEHGEHSGGEIQRAADPFSRIALPQGEHENADQNTDQRFEIRSARVVDTCITPLTDQRRETS